MSWTYRALCADDQPAWRAMRVEALRRFPSAFLTTVEEQQARSGEADRDMLAQGRWRGLFRDADMAAQSALLPMIKPAARHRFEIGGFYVSPAHHGTGAADDLMNAMAEDARQNGGLQLELSVAADNLRAIRFYERHGFERFGTLPRAMSFDGQLVDDYFYVRFLDR